MALKGGSGSMAVVTVAGVPGILALSEGLGWQSPFLVVAAFGILACLVGLRSLPALTAHLQQRDGRGPVDNLRVLMSTPGARGSLLMPILHLVGVFMLIPYVSPFIQNNLGYPRAELGTRRRARGP